MKKYFIIIFIFATVYFLYFETGNNRPPIPDHQVKKRFKIINKPASLIELNKEKSKSFTENFNPPPVDVDIIKFDVNSSFEDDKYYSKFLESYHNGDYKNVLIYGKNILKIPDKYSKEYWYGNVIHTTNIILGKVNFSLGNIQEGEFYLLNSVDTKYISKTPNGIYSPQLSSFGPDTSLAYDLYKLGQRESVLKYFQGLKAFWEIGVENGYIDNSIFNIKNGAKIPDDNVPENDSDNDENTGFPYKGGLFSIPVGE